MEPRAVPFDRAPLRVERRALASHLGLFELGGGNSPIESGAQLLGRLERELDSRPCPGIEAGVEEVERDDVAQRSMACVVVGNDCLRQRKPFVAALGHTLGAGDLDDGGAHRGTPTSPDAYFLRCWPKNAKTLLQPSMHWSTR